jgi:hypothetical protein
MAAHDFDVYFFGYFPGRSARSFDFGSAMLLRKKEFIARLRSGRRRFFPLVPKLHLGTFLFSEAALRSG